MMFLTFAVLLTAAFLTGIFVWISWKRFKFCRILSAVPGPKAWPLVGNMLQFDKTPQGFYEQLQGWAKQYESHGCFCIWFGTQPFVVISKAQHVEKILSSQKNISKNRGYDLIHPWLGTGLLTSTGEKWASRRRLLNPAFHYQILNDFIPVYQRQSNVLIQLLQEKCDKGEFDIALYLRLFTLDTICEAVMGVRTNALVDSSTKYVSTVLRISELIIERWRSPWLWKDFIYNLTAAGRQHEEMLKVLHGFTNKVISDRIKLREEQKSKNDETPGVVPINPPRKRQAFLDLLLDEYDKGMITKEGVREEVDTFMFEGHDTTASSLQWAVHMIGRHPEIQSRLQDEVDRFYENAGEDVITGNHLRELEYLECVIKETLRILPSVPLIGREVTEECTFGSYLIPRGCAVVLNSMGIHRDPDVWEEPETFNPERFLIENTTGRNPFSHIPFSAGPRNCIGQRFAMMEEKVVLASIVRHFNIKSTQVTENIKITADMILSSTDGIIVTLEPRDTSNF